MSDGQQQCDSALDMSLSGLSLPESYVGDGGANPDVNGMYGVTGRLERTFDHPPLFNPNEIHRSGSVLTSNSTFDTSGFLSNFPTPRYDAQNEGMFGPTGVGSQSLQNLLNPFAQLFNQSGMDFGIPPISNMMPPGFSSQQQQNVNNRSVESFHSLDDFGGFGRVISGGMPSSGAMPFSVGWDGRMEPANVNMNELTNFCPGWMNVSGPMPIVFPANPYIPLEEQQNFYQPYGGIPSAYGNRPDAGRSENPPDQQIQQERSTQTLGDLSTVLLPMNRFYMPYKVSNRQIHLERGVTPRIPSMGSSDGLLRPESSCCRSLLHSFTSADSGIQSGGPMSSAPHTPENISSGSDEQCTGGRRKRNRPEKSSQMNSLLRKMTEMSETGMIPSTICQSNTSDADNTAMLTRSRKRKRPERKPVTPAEMVSHAVVYKNKAYFALPVQLQVKNRGEQEQPVFDFVGKQWDERTYSSRVKKNLLKTKITARSLKTLLENQDLVDKGAADPLAKTATSTTQESNTLEQRLMQGIPVTATSKKSKGKKLARSRLIPAKGCRFASTDGQNETNISNESDGRLEENLLQLMSLSGSSREMSDICETSNSSQPTSESQVSKPTKLPGRVRRNPRPKHLGFDYLQIGQFQLVRNLADKKQPNNNKLKIHFGLENVVYEFRVDRSTMEKSLNLGPNPNEQSEDTRPMLVTIIIPFITIVGLDCRAKEVLLELNKVPDMLVGFSRSAMYNCNRVDGRTVDITNGNLATIRFHKLVLTPRHGGFSFGQSLCKFHDYFKRIHKTIAVYDSMAETSSPPSLRFVSAENIEVDQAIPNALLMKNQTHQMEDISNDSDSPVVVEATEVNYEHDKKKSPKPKVLLCGLEEEDEEEVVPPLTPLGAAAAEFVAAYQSNPISFQMSQITAEENPEPENEVYVEGTTRPLMCSTLQMKLANSDNP